MRLNAKALGLAIGIVWGLSVFLATAWIVFFGGPRDVLAGIGAFYIGYEVSWSGAVVGLGYGFVDGLVGGLVLAWIYNAFLPRPDLP